MLHPVHSIAGGHRHRSAPSDGYGGAHGTGCEHARDERLAVSGASGLRFPRSCQPQQHFGRRELCRRRRDDHQPGWRRRGCCFGPDVVAESLKRDVCACA
eukprot:6199649-Prymnesium_polylepis.1